MIDRKEFRDQIAGRGFEGIRDLLVEDCSRIKPGKLKVAQSEHVLAAAVLRCALKTLVVTRVVWKDRIEHLRRGTMVKQARKFFPDAARFRIAVTPYTSGVKNGLKQERVKSELDIRRNSVSMLQVLDANGTVAGNVVSTEWAKLPVDRVLYWIVSPDGKIVDVVVGSGWPSEEISGLFQTMQGKNLASLRDCKTATELAATEVLVLIASLD